MAAQFNIDAYSDALVLLGTAGIVVPMVRRFGLSPVLGFLAAGALLGPLGLGSLIHALPLLYWLTVVDAKNVAGIAELGVVFLFFLIGLELTYERLKAMRRLVFGLGSLQFILTTAVIAGIAALFGNPSAVSIILGACLALSSTAIVIEVLSNQGRLGTTAGRTSFAILLAQDLAVIPVLVFISILGKGSSSSVMASLALALVNATVAVVAMVILGRLLLRPLFRLVAATGASELFVAATLFVIIGTGVAAAVAGLSMALGAFIAGLLLAETEFRKAIETTIGPFKGLLLGFFFFTVGMNIDVREIAREPFWLVASVIGLIGIKAILLAGLARTFRLPWHAAIETGLLLGPGGEFAFVGIGLATSLGLISANVSSFTLAVTSITMALIPVLALVARRLAPKFRELKALDPELGIAPSGGAGHAIVIGHGRVGEVVCSLLGRHNCTYLAVDNDADAVPGHRRSGREVYYGDATDPEFLKSCGVMDAKAVIVTVAAKAAIDEIVRQVRALRADIVIVSRARDADHARHLYEIGVTDAVPETIEASLQLSEAALIGLEQAIGPVIASIHEKRDEFRRELQQAAAKSPAETTRAIRPKSFRSPRAGL
ncbi:cation:proton antiporter [Bradyrhizobium sp. AUGA SZCCT0182]|uniref:cation:proton antiporter domain-containing protein n=1 Tax=Bradyrhizobium sp. AUGA SZCCT0182 TaxID=2807667 RepID=UPI001BA9E3D8|nr:cation:proton antiporter [Bradyrhizobium sp. AUGA SZCCT0182]MBR1234399.1 cation:proton antiporter [Bradyrhizobium sp. AUGA SZCCT0182]